MHLGRRAKVCCQRLTLCATSQRSCSRLDSAPADTALLEIYKKPAASWSPSFSHSPQGNRHRNQVPDTCAGTPAEPASLPGWAQLSPFTNPVFPKRPPRVAPLISRAGGRGRCMVRTRAGRSVPRINQAVGFPLPPGPNNRDCGRPLPDSRDGAQEESRHGISDRHDRKRSRPRAQRLA